VNLFLLAFVQNLEAEDQSRKFKIQITEIITYC
jgi:hypothetical protein